MGTPGRASVTLLVADGDVSFVESVTDAIDSVGAAVSTTVATTADDASALVREPPSSTGFDGIILGDRLDAFVDTLEQITTETDLPVVVLTDGTDQVVNAAVQSGVTDYFPRTTSPEQYALLIERLTTDRPSATTPPPRSSTASATDDSQSGSAPTDEQSTTTGSSTPASTAATPPGTREVHTRDCSLGEALHDIDDAIVVHDPESSALRFVNDPFCAMFDCDGPDLLGRSQEASDRDPERDAVTTARAVVDELVEYTEPTRLERAVETNDDDPRWIELNGTPVQLDGETLYVSIGREITERKRFEQRFRTIADRVEEMIHFVNADDMDVLYVNSAFTDIFGRSVEELYDDPGAFYDAIHPDDLGPHREKIDAMLADMEARDPDDSYDFAFRIERPGGELRWVESTVYPILEDATEPHRYVGVTEDVTERYRRERTLETFHEATRELTAVESRDAAARLAVEAAEDVLEFPFVSVHLYDDESGTLEPVARSDNQTDSSESLPSFGPGDSLPWQVYLDGESTTSSNPTRDLYGAAVPTPDLVLSLGTHGVMLVGASDTDFDTEDTELAQILAATLEAALNHVAGQRELAEREQELEQHQARANRLERFNTLIRNIEEATIDASSRTAIEDAVCTRLSEFDQYDLAWIAEPSPKDEELVVRAHAGTHEPYVDALTGRLVRGETRHPAVVAAREDAPKHVDNVATDVTGGEWRKTALGHGIQSVVSVPVGYEDAVHGVLTIASETPAAFDASTLDLLDGLGQSIGYAITVAEREQALESEGTTELEFAIDDDGLFMIRCSAATDCTISLQRTVRRSGGVFSTFYLVEGADPKEVVERAGATPSIDTAQVVSTDSDDPAGLIETTTSTWFGTAFTEAGAVVREANATAGTGRLLVEVPHGTDVRALVERFQRQYPDAELIAKRQRERAIHSLFELQDALETELTDRQWEAFQTAYSAGYFAWPREASGREVAELLGVTQPTFNKHLRLAIQKAVRLLIERDAAPASDGAERRRME